MSESGGDRQVQALLGEDAKLEDGAVVDAETGEPLESVRESESDDDALADVLILGGLGLFAISTVGMEFIFVTTAVVLSTVLLLYVASTMLTTPSL